MELPISDDLPGEVRDPDGDDALARAAYSRPGHRRQRYTDARRLWLPRGGRRLALGQREQLVGRVAAGEIVVQADLLTVRIVREVDDPHVRAPVPQHGASRSTAACTDGLTITSESNTT